MCQYVACVRQELLETANRKHQSEAKSHDLLRFLGWFPYVHVEAV